MYPPSSTGGLSLPNFEGFQFNPPLAEYARFPQNLSSLVLRKLLWFSRVTENKSLRA
jgi:hypothetical protein